MTDKPDPTKILDRDLIVEPAEVTGYRELFDALADLVEASDKPGLAALAIMNAAIAVAHSTIGPDALRRVLAVADQNMELAEAQARGQVA